MQRLDVVEDSIVSIVPRNVLDSARGQNRTGTAADHA